MIGVAKGQGRVRPAPATIEEWSAGLRARYRPSVVELVSVFDKLPRRPDEEEWRAALVEELLDQMEAGIGSGDLDAVALEQRVFATLMAMQVRIKQALQERQPQEAAED